MDHQLLALVSGVFIDGRPKTGSKVRLGLLCLTHIPTLCLFLWDQDV